MAKSLNAALAVLMLLAPAWLFAAPRVITLSPANTELAFAAGITPVGVSSYSDYPNMVAIAPEWLAQEFEEQFGLQLLPLPLEMDSRTCYLSWHETAGQERSHRWMAELLIKICQR